MKKFKVCETIIAIYLHIREEKSKLTLCEKDVAWNTTTPIDNLFSWDAKLK